MPESFEIEGTVVGLEQKRYREGGGLIPGFWNVTLQTDEGRRSCSFNSDRRKNPRAADGEREPHPDFSLIQRAQASGERVRIAGDITRKGDNAFKNGRSAKLVDPGRDAPEASQDRPADLDDAKWAVEQALEHAEVSDPLSDDDRGHVRREAEKLLEVAQDVAGGSPASRDGVVDLDRRREERRRREGA